MIVSRQRGKVLLGLLLGWLVLTGDARAASFTRALTPELELALFLLKASDPVPTVEKAIKDVEDALAKLGQKDVFVPTPPNRLGRLVLHDRRLQRRALRILRLANLELSRRIAVSTSKKKPTVQKLIAAQADVQNAITKVQNTLRMPFLF
jgi:hypothetical protein